tara:strand:- start:703 stop:1233 length:531 start_codon:yes stop_codon:yes gene_type:complete
MSTQVRTNVFGQQFIALPLVLKNVGTSVVRFKNIFVKNNVEHFAPLEELHLNFTINESASDYSQAHNLLPNDTQNLHKPISAIDVNKNFIVQKSFSLEPGNSFFFEVIFNPNVSRFNILQGQYGAGLRIDYDVDGHFNMSFSATVDEKDLVTFGGISYDSIDTIMTVERSRIIKIG